MLRPVFTMGITCCFVRVNLSIETLSLARSILDRELYVISNCGIECVRNINRKHELQEIRRTIWVQINQLIIYNVMLENFRWHDFQEKSSILVSFVGCAVRWLCSFGVMPFGVGAVRWWYHSVLVPFGGGVVSFGGSAVRWWCGIVRWWCGNVRWW